jgi:peptidoglycan hydrolase-like protein with peptidoglycan-binding domain
MTIQATDASSTVATSTCNATIVPLPVPSIASFLAAPTTITVGQSAVLSWTVNNASSTSISGISGVGTVSGTSITVTPTVTTTYTLSVVNPQGTTTANATVTVNPVATTTPPATGVMAQIQALLAQINALKAQIGQLVTGQIGGGSGSGTGTTTPPVIGPGGKICVSSIGRDIRRGDYGDDVKDLQKFLAKHPSIYPEGIINGFYGPLTIQAVKRWQKQNGIEGTGFFGPMTRKYWREHCEDNDGRWMASSTISTSASTSISTWIDQALSKKKSDDHDKNKGKGKKGNDGRDDD